MPKMYELVDDNVVDQAHRGLDDAPVQADGSDSVTAPPPFLLVRDDDAGHRDAGLRPPRFHPLRQPFCRVTAEPREEVGSHVGRLQRSRRHGHVEPAAAQLRISGRVAMNLQAIVPAEIQHALAANELTRRERRVVRLHAPESLDDPRCRWGPPSPPPSSSAVRCGGWCTRLASRLTRGRRWPSPPSSPGPTSPRAVSSTASPTRPTVRCPAALEAGCGAGGGEAPVDLLRQLRRHRRRAVFWRRGEARAVDGRDPPRPAHRDRETRGKL